MIDEEGEEYETIYLVRKTGLSGGWMGFAVAHNLAYGDTLVFELVRPTAFKVCKPFSYLTNQTCATNAETDDQCCCSSVRFTLQELEVLEKAQRYELIMSGIWK